MHRTLASMLLLLAWNASADTLLVVKVATGTEPDGMAYLPK